MTKNNPGNFDCYANAAPDEPMFVLLGRDPSAALLIRIWVEIRKHMGELPEKLTEALACADACEAWARKLGKEAKLLETADAFDEALKDGNF